MEIHSREYIQFPINVRSHFLILFFDIYIIYHKINIKLKYFNFFSLLLTGISITLTWIIILIILWPSLSHYVKVVIPNIFIYKMEPHIKRKFKNIRPILGLGLGLGCLSKTQEFFGFKWMCLNFKAFN